MKRLIDEEDAIRAICKNCYAEDGGDYKDCRYYPCDDVQAIEALPSTDLERIKAIMKKTNEQDKQMGRPTDLISRADAIGAVVAWTVEDRPTEEMPTDLVDRLKALPSADADWKRRVMMYLADLQLSCDPHTEIGKAKWEALEMAFQGIADMHSAEAVQGEWIKTGGGNGWNEWWVFKCPFCGATIEDKQYRSWEYNFCPNCGARMKGADNETD